MAAEAMPKQNTQSKRVARYRAKLIKNELERLYADVGPDVASAVTYEDAKAAIHGDYFISDNTDRKTVRAHIYALVGGTVYPPVTDPDLSRADVIGVPSTAKPRGKRSRSPPATIETDVEEEEEEKEEEVPPLKKIRVADLFGEKEEEDIFSSIKSREMVIDQVDKHREALIKLIDVARARASKIPDMEEELKETVIRLSKLDAELSSYKASLVKCPICAQTVAAVHSFSYVCEHKSCATCMKEYIEAGLKEKGDGALECPICGEEEEGEIPHKITPTADIIPKKAHVKEFSSSPFV